MMNRYKNKNKLFTPRFSDKKRGTRSDFFMTLKSYLWGIRISTVAAFVAWVLVIWNIDPEKSAIVGQALFYASAFLFFAGIFILFFTRLRKICGKNEESALTYLGASFRQGVLISILIVIVLILQQHRMLTWWDSALIVAGIMLAELYFLTRK